MARRLNELEKLRAQRKRLLGPKRPTEVKYRSLDDIRMEQMAAAVDSLIAELDNLLNKQRGDVAFGALTMCIAQALSCAPNPREMLRFLTETLTEKLDEDEVKVSKT